MVWCSTTSVARLGADERMGVWKCICSVEEGPARDKTKVCCYFMQGICRYSKTCEFLHDLKLGTETGCHYRNYCNYGHGAVAQTLRGVSGAIDPGSGHDGGFLDRARKSPIEDAAFVECRGHPFDGTDPLWGELSSALMQPEKDIGDADLSHPFLSDLSERGLYKQVEESDEWLCLPSSVLERNLEAVQDRFMVLRHDWIVDDMIDAKDLWNDVWACVCRRREPKDTGMGLSVEADELQKFSELVEATPRRLSDKSEDLLQKASEKVNITLQRAFDLKPGHTTANGVLDKVSHVFFNALEVARDSVVELLQLCSRFTRERWERFESQRSAWLLAGDRVLSYEDRSKLEEGRSHLGNPLDDDLQWQTLNELPQLHSYRVSQLLCCLERCLFVCRSFPEVHRRTRCQDFGNDRNCAFGIVEPAIGDEAEVIGLKGDAEYALNGQIGLIEGYHEDLRLWQLRLKESGTRILLSREQLATPTRMAKPTLLDLVRKAASEGDYVLVHHVMVWPRNESIE